MLEVKQNKPRNDPYLFHGRVLILKPIMIRPFQFHRRLAAVVLEAISKTKNAAAVCKGLHCGRLYENIGEDASQWKRHSVAVLS